MYVATHEIVDAYLRSIPIGIHTSLQQMRNYIAAEHNSQYTCRKFWLIL